MMKNRICSGAVFFLSFLLPATLLAAPDTYIGDAAIYSALDTGGTRPKPHVLLLVDNSRATLNKASGVRYVFNAADPYPDNGYDTWSVYAADNQGNFSRVEIASSTSSLEGITCNTAGGELIKTTLLNSGTYSGSGTSAEPNLQGGACDTGPKGATYALGNYLNYLESTSGEVTTDAVVRKKTYTCTVTRKTGNPKTTTVTDGCVATYQFTSSGTHITSAATEPGVGADWQSVWTQTSSGCLSAASAYCSSTSTPASITVDAAIPTWTLGETFTVADEEAFAGDTQREIFYSVLAQVIDGARYAVKFGAMTYNPNNQGGDLVYPISDLSSEANFNAFKAALPQGGEDDGAPLITSQTNRPQAEALFDAGYYLGATYPTSGTISSTAVFPLNNASFSREYVSSAMAGEYLSTNRNQCEYNHIILITNGLSNGDNSPDLAPIVDADGDGRANEVVYGGGSHYLDDVAAYLYKQEKIVTHTVLAFQSSDSLVERAAAVGGGDFYNVYSAEELADALTKLLASIVLETDTSFVAPVVPASSTNRTISSNRVYLGLFKPQSNRPWLGNLKKYGVNHELELEDKDGTVATDEVGDFLPESKSFWGAKVGGGDDGRIMSIDGLLPLAVGAVAGDGGNVAAGGVGGTLKLALQEGLAASPSQVAWEVRKIYTKPSGSTSSDLTDSQNRFSPSNALITVSALDVADATEKDQLINYVAGADGFDDNNDGNSTEIRDWVLGDILHSKPLIFSYSSYTEAQENNLSFNKSMIYVGSNDGMLHAFRDANGSEAWAFIPDNLLPKLKYLRESEHYYFSDGTAVAYVHDVNNNNIIETGSGDKVVLIFGQGRGGGRNTLDATDSRGAYYALNVSNPEAPVQLWKIDSTTTGFGELGETWSTPRLARIKIGSTSKVVAFVGAGYDNNEDRRFGDNMLFPASTTSTDTTLPTSDGDDISSGGGSNPLNPRGRGIYAIEVATLSKDAGNNYQPAFGTGSLLWSFTYDSTHSEKDDMTYSIPSDLTVLDMDGDGFSDRIYVADTGGQVWRFDVGATDTAQWTGRRIFNANGSSDASKGRKIFYKPTVALTNGIPTLYFGTGDRSHPLNLAVTDRMFMVRDRGQTSPVDSGNLINLTENRLQATDVDPDEIEDILNGLGASSNYGWYIDLERDGEKILASPLVFNKQAFFTSYTPDSDADLDPCEIGNLGTSRMYQVDYATGEAVQNYYTGNDENAADIIAANIRAKGEGGVALQKEDREKTIGVGIPSGIVTLIDASGRVTLMISSSNRVGTYQAPDAKMISPLYWMQY